jgi:hypothetical protein
MSGESFDIEVEILGEGETTQLHVIPGEHSYMVLLDGVDITTISYDAESLPSWHQVVGNLDQADVSKIGDAIESKLR